MDYGRLTDHLGKNIDFTNVILIMTSNIGKRNNKRKSYFLGGFSETDNNNAINKFLVQSLEIGLMQQLTSRC